MYRKWTRLSAPNDGGDVWRRYTRDRPKCGWWKGDTDDHD